MALRPLALRRGIACKVQELGAGELELMHSDRCPVLRVLLRGVDGQPHVAVFERLNPQIGYAAGNAAVMSHAAAKARAGVGVVDALRRANRIAARADSLATQGGLDAAA